MLFLSVQPNIVRQVTCHIELMAHQWYIHSMVHTHHGSRATTGKVAPKMAQGQMCLYDIQPLVVNGTEIE